MPLVEIESFPDRTVAEMARGLLASHGVDAILFDGGIASLGLGGLTPARLMVDSGDETRARRILANPA